MRRANIAAGVGAVCALLGLGSHLWIFLVLGVPSILQMSFLAVSSALTLIGLVSAVRAVAWGGAPYIKALLLVIVLTILSALWNIGLYQAMRDGDRQLARLRASSSEAHGGYSAANQAESSTPQHGRLLWIYRRNRAWFSAPGLDPVTGGVYVGDSRGRVFALRGEDGFAEWITDARPGQPVLSAPVAGPGATVYVTTGGGRVLALDSRDGHLKWVFRTDWGIADSPVVGPNHLLYFQNDAGEFYAVDARTGRQRWTFAGGREGATPGNVGSPAMVGARLVVFASRNGNIYGLDAETGRRQWVFEPVSVPSKRRRMDYARLAFGGMAVSDEGTVYIGASDGRVHALDGHTGRQIRAYDGASEAGCTPALGTHGALYFKGGNGCLQCVDRQSGKRIWQSGNTVGAAPVAGTDGRVYCGGAGPDDLQAYDGLNGRRKWEYQQLDAQGYDHIAPRGEIDYLLYSSFSSPLISGRTIYVGEVDNQDPYDPNVPYSGEGRAVLAVRAPVPGGPDLAAPVEDVTPMRPQEPHAVSRPPARAHAAQ